MISFSFKKLSDKDLVIGLQTDPLQSRRYENILYERFSSLVKLGIRKHGLNEEESINVYSDTILAAIKQIKNQSFEQRSELKTFIFKIFSNKCVDQYRKTTTNKSTGLQTIDLNDYSAIIPDNQTILQSLIQQSEIQLIYQKLELIGQKCQLLLKLWNEGFTDEEIMDSLAYNSTDVVKSSRQRCLSKLKDLVFNSTQV
ncbi:MAG: RNA polymerase sigma factor [Flectobacillus sp.]|uniref:RNA polymerase sigma factor n=1 Tax=Flectobacillus sp. TaxID=50419 RepID=UPI003B9DA49D